MQRHASSQLQRELGALLAREDGRIHGQDVGALLGQAALAFEVPLAVAPFPLALCRRRTTTPRRPGESRPGRLRGGR